ncbi:MAG: GNAT family N-acetyltransferase [Clostridiales bacterium]|nr:GNAT family N-acetyltransferase [Clostridiales bacterium]
METVTSDDEDSSDYILKLWKYKKEISINIVEKGVKIGYIEGILLNVNNILNELKSEEALKILEFTDKEDEEEVKNFYIQVLSKNDFGAKAFYITELFIEKEYRGKGVGSKIFEILPQFLRKIDLDITCIYLMPGPLERVNGKVKYIMNPKDEQMVALKNKLIRFYESVGFKRINQTDFFIEKIS